MEAGDFVKNVRKLNDVLEYATPDLRIELLCRHEHLHGVANELAARLMLNRGHCDEALEDDLNAAERRASELDSLSRLQRDGATQEGRSSGGKGRAKATSATREEYAARARELLARGNDPRSVVGILAERFHRDPTTIRRALKKAGIR
jgi:hypothetical protein